MVTAKNIPGMRSAGRPTATAASAGDGHGDGEGDEQVGAAVDEEGGGRGAADAGERELAEADLTGPAGEHHERDGKDAEDDQRGRERELRRAEPRRAPRRRGRAPATASAWRRTRTSGSAASTRGIGRTSRSAA